MKLTIDNHDGKGAVDYTASIVAGRPFRITRRLNEPVTCELTLLPAPGLATPSRNGRVIVTDDSGNILFTGYLATEPALELAGQGTTGPVYRVGVSAISDEILLNRQPIPQTGAMCGTSAGQAIQAMLARAGVANIGSSVALAAQNVPVVEMDSGRTWAENAGALAAAVRSAYLLMNGTLTLTPVGTVTHSLSEAQGTLSLSALDLSMVKALANDVTVCGETEPCAYVTEFFQGDGTTALFDLTRDPWMPAASKSRPLTDGFTGPAINPQIWSLDDPGGCLQVTSAGLSSSGGSGTLGSAMLSAISNLELGGSLVLEANNVQFGAQTSGVMNGLFQGGLTTLAACFAGFQISQPNGAATIAPVVNGAVAGSSFTPVAGHMYTLRLRIYAPEMQRILQAYYVVGANGGTECFGGSFAGSPGSALFEVQDTTNGVAGAPVVLYSGSIGGVPPYCLFAPLNSACLQCSIGNVTVEQQGPVWVTSTPASGAPFVRRLGTTAQGADCEIERTGKLRFYPASMPQAGELIAVSYRTTHRSVARMASAASIAAESQGGALPGTACWIGSVTSPVPRSSADCENAANAILALSTSRAAAWSGRYTAWNPEQQIVGHASAPDIWPGDVLAVASASAGVTANLVVRTVQIDVGSSSPALVKYTIAFANDWADNLSIRTSAAVPADAWLPQAPEAALPLANLNSLAVTSVTGNTIQISAGATPPTGGGFEVRRRDWAFSASAGPDLVLRSQVPNFTFPRQAATEQYYIRMYDGSTPPNYSRFSSAVFVNVPL